MITITTVSKILDMVSNGEVSFLGVNGFLDDVRFVENLSLEDSLSYVVVLGDDLLLVFCMGFVVGGVDGLGKGFVLSLVLGFVLGLVLSFSDVLGH